MNLCNFIGHDFKIYRNPESLTYFSDEYCSRCGKKEISLKIEESSWHFGFIRFNSKE